MALTKTQFGYRRHPDQDRAGANIAEHAIVVVGAAGTPTAAGGTVLGEPAVTVMVPVAVPDVPLVLPIS